MWAAGWPGQGRVLESVPGFCQLDARSSPRPRHGNQKCFQILPNAFGEREGQNPLWLRFSAINRKLLFFFYSAHSNSHLIINTLSEITLHCPSGNEPKARGKAALCEGDSPAHVGVLCGPDKFPSLLSLGSLTGQRQQGGHSPPPGCCRTTPSGL